MKLAFTSNVTPWPESIDCRSGLHQESREKLWLTRERKVFFVPEKAEWFKISLAEWWHPPGNSIHHRQRHSPTHPTVGSIVEVHVGMCTLMRSSSRSWLCGFILKGLVWDLLFLLLKDDLGLSMVSGVRLCSPLSVFWVCMVSFLHPRMMAPRGNTCNFNCSRGS